MALLVLAPTAVELAATVPGLDANNLEELRPIKGKIASRTALFCVCGIGPVNAALASGFCLGLTAGINSSGERLEGVILVGLAGAFDLTAQPLGSLWLVREEIWPEYGLNDGSIVTAGAFRFPQWRSPNGEEVRDSLELASAETLGGNKGAFPECTSLTVAGVTASFARAQSLWHTYHAALENMEGFAVALAFARAGLPCLEIRSVSNKAGPRRPDEKDFPCALSALAKVFPTLNLM